MNEIIRPEDSQEIHTFQDAQNFLYNRLSDIEKRLFRHGEGWTARTNQWMELIGNPQEKFPTIHVAGTSGKGSTCYMLTAFLGASDKKIGTHLSPHTYDIRERMLLNADYIDENNFTQRLKNIIPRIASMEGTDVGRPIYFEVMYALAMQFYADEMVDYGVVETGVGGRFDPTNVVKRSDKLAVISRLGLDHTNILGDTMEAIAWQKGGIIPTQGQAIALEPLEPESKYVLQEIAHERQAELRFVDPLKVIRNATQTIEGIYFDYQSELGEFKDLKLPLIGEFQLENVALAITAAIIIAKRDGWVLNEEGLRGGLENLAIPARTEIKDIRGHTVLIDGAHNPQKLKALFRSLETIKLQQKPHVVFASKEGKDYQQSVDVIGQGADMVYPTRFFMRQENPFLANYSADAQIIEKTFSDHGYAVSTSFDNPLLALEAAMRDAKPGQPIVVTGSLYMIGELHEMLKASDH